MSETPTQPGDAEAWQRLRQDVDRHRRIAEASYALHTTLDVGELLGLILDTAKAGVRADRGTVFVLTDDGSELWSRVLSGSEDLEIRLPVGRGLAGHVAATGETLRIADVQHDPRFDPSWDEKSGYETCQVLCAPIRHREGRVIGVFQLLNKVVGDFDEEDESFLAALSVHAALAIENARLHRSALEKERQDREIRLVQNVQRAYQPERMEHEVGTLSAAGLNVLCEDASGDYYDVFDLPSGRLAVVVGDVSGHGLGAALVMAQARALLRAFSWTQRSLPTVMNLLNDFLTRDMTQGRFMSLFVALADPATGAVEWHSAGHPPVLLWRAAKQCMETLEPQGRVLGILPDADFGPTEPLRLEPGDLLLAYTDGATEARRPRDRAMLEQEGLTEVLRGLVGEPPPTVLDGIRAALASWTDGAEIGDDLTLVALKRG